MFCHISVLQSEEENQEGGEEEGMTDVRKGSSAPQSVWFQSLAGVIWVPPKADPEMTTQFSSVHCRRGDVWETVSIAGLERFSVRTKGAGVFFQELSKSVAED